MTRSSTTSPHQTAFRPAARATTAAAVGAAALMLLLAGCAPQSAESSATESGAAESAQGTVALTSELPESFGIADYQLGGGYPPPAGVTTIARDSTDEPEPGAYNICYINGFQTQPGDTWPADLVLADEDGGRLVDPNWPDENIIDTSTDTKRADAATRQFATIDGCASDGFDAVEFDNLDSYSRSNDQLTLDDAVAFATLLTEHAHDAGLAAGQKNTGELEARGRDDVGFDFVIAEECDQFEECGSFTDVYGEHVIDIEYTDDLRRPFEEVCADESTPTSTILRDRDLAPVGSADYIYEHC